MTFQDLCADRFSTLLSKKLSFFYDLCDVYNLYNLFLTKLQVITAEN